MKATVIFRRKFSFTDQSSGRPVTGCKLIYLSDQVNLADSSGREPITLAAPIEVYDKLSHVPGEYDLNIQVTMKKGSGATAPSPVAQVLDVAFIPSQK